MSDSGLPAVLPLLLLGTLAACAPSSETERPVFRPGIEDGPVPWTGIPEANGGPLRFAIVSDRTGAEFPGVFEAAFPKIDLLQPDLVMSVGDITETWLASTRPCSTRWATTTISTS